MGSLGPSTTSNGVTNALTLTAVMSETTNGVTATNGHATNGHSVNGHVYGSTNGNNAGGMMPIAICGMALRLPAGLTNPTEMWEFVLNKGDARSRVPESRYSVSAYHSTTGKSGSVATQYGYFLDEEVDLGALDTSFFSMPRSEVERADPQQRLLLEVARECFDDAGVTNWKGKAIGCYVGSFGEDWVDMFARETQPSGNFRVTGYGDFAISNRLSYEFDLQGPSMTIRTACSSALTALNEACMAISRGDCESAIVGGVNLIMSPTMTMAMTEQGVLSTDGSCKSFSAEANGYARGEAITAIYVKPLSAAIKDGNPIRAVIKGTSINVDGRTPGLSQPSTHAQEALIRRAYEVAGITDFGATAMVECHGTGTAIGDPIEAKAVARVFGESGVYIGSVKPNLGHAEGASGLVSVIKMVLALENRIIPPNIRFKTPNPNIPFDSAKLTVPLEPTPWPQSKLERVSVNSFGIGGANAHAILESAYQAGVHLNASEASQQESSGPRLLLYSANSTKSLTRMLSNYEHWVDKNSGKITDLAYTLALNREHLPYRAFSVFNKGINGNSSIPAKTMPKPKVVMVFTGQGAQWPQMGRELLQSNVTFQTSIRNLDNHLQAATYNKPGYSIQEELLKPAKESRMNLAELSQPLCTAVQIALVDTLRSLSVVPDAVVGHSSGEIAAAYASGALTARYAIVAAHHRGAVTTLQKRAGSMAAIGMGWKETEKYLIPNTNIACDNSPRSVTISGDTDAIKSVVADIKKSTGVLARLLQVNKAYHSHHMLEIGDQYLALIEEVVANEPTTLFFSSVTGKLLKGDRLLDSKYWQDNLESPVRFRKAIQSILNHEVGQNALFLEIGPHAALSGPIRQTSAEVSSSAPYISVLSRNQDCVESLLNAVGKLHCLHVPIDLKSLFPIGSCLSNLPTYPWNHEGSHLFESRLSKEWRQRKHPYHDFLGAKVVESTDIEPTWRNLFHIRNTPWVRDHKVGDDIVFPFCGYIAICGEAVRQISGIDEGFSIRNMIVDMALILSEAKPTEILTTLRPHRLTKSLNSPWWEFTIASYNGQNIWTKHCTGEVMALQETNFGQVSEPEGLPRKIVPRRWYETLRKGGLDLGPLFQTLETMETSTNAENQASGKVINGRQGDEKNYFIHPTVLDSTLQLLGAAAVNGCARKIRNWLPTSVDELSITRCSSDMISSVSAKKTSNASLLGEGQCISQGFVVLKASGIRMTPSDGLQLSNVLDTHAAARYTWNSAIDFLDTQKMLGPVKDRASIMVLLEELLQGCLISSKTFLSEYTATPHHMQNYAAWIEAHNQLTIGSLEEDTNSIEDLVRRLSETSAASVASALQQAHTNPDLLFAGHQIFSDEMINELHKFLGQLDRSEFLRLLSHSIPNLRILEIGTGRDALASDVLKDLRLPRGQVLCSRYTVTTKGFISAKHQDKLFPNMEFMTLDISKELVEQGFDEDRKYDLIMVSNILQEPKLLQQSLANIRRLLSPNGRVLLQELCSSSDLVNYLFGSQPDWSFETQRPSDWEPSFRKLWESEFLAAGFDGVQGIIYDSPEPHQNTATVITRLPSIKKVSKQVTVLRNEKGSGTCPIISQLEAAGYEITNCDIEDTPPLDQDIISLLDENEPFFEALTESRYESLKTFLQRLGNSGILWVTPSLQVGCLNPSYAQVIGFARAMRSEMFVDFATCEVSSFDAAEKVVDIFAAFQKRSHDDALNPDFEYAIQNGEVKIGRFYPFALRNELMTSSESEPDDRISLDVGIPGRVNSLCWQREPREELESGDVEIEVYSAGLNFRDILVALGIVELPIRQFGLEAAGFITRVGPDVKDLKIGDRVLCWKKQAFSTFITVPEFSCAKLPDSLHFDEAATMVVPYVTAIHSLISVGGLEKGQSVLIHSAAGGVGLAAIQIAQMLGAEIYVTVGNDEKVQYLMDNFKIPRNRILFSRDSSFVEDLMRETDGKGVEIALNSLSGELLHATWTCVAEFGKMIEIGKRDLFGGGKLDMETFLANRTYTCVDIDQICWKKPAVLRKLILGTLEYYVQGHTTPVRPIKIFDASETQDAFRYMQKGLHIGRVGLRLRPSPESFEQRSTSSHLISEVTERTRQMILSPSASYLLVGGLGGLGKAISAWMVEHDARELIFLSRSAGQGSNDELFAKELESMGCNVKLVRGDVENLDDVSKAVALATLPLKGIIQMSMVLHDQTFETMSFENWKAAIGPKVRGTWNLHNATISAGASLDFFVLFSSLSGLIGNPGQANYASANTFLDAFVQYRTGMGLAASAVDIGAVEDIGFISQADGLMSKMKSSGFKGIMEQELLDAMAVAMKPQFSVLGAPGSFADRNTFVLGLRSSIPLNSPSNRAVWKKDRRMAAYHNTDASGSTGTAASDEILKTFLGSARADPAILKAPEAATVLAQEIGKQLFDLLLKPHEDLNTAWPLVDLGLDSLVATELRAWWKQVFAFDISVLEMLGTGSLQALGQHAAEGLVRVAEEGRERG